MKKTLIILVIVLAAVLGITLMMKMTGTGIYSEAEKSISRSIIERKTAEVSAFEITTSRGVKLFGVGAVHFKKPPSEKLQSLVENFVSQAENSADAVHNDAFAELDTAFHKEYASDNPKAQDKFLTKANKVMETLLAVQGQVPYQRMENIHHVSVPVLFGLRENGELKVALYEKKIKVIDMAEDKVLNSHQSLMAERIKAYLFGLKSEDAGEHLANSHRGVASAAPELPIESVDAKFTMYEMRTAKGKSLYGIGDMKFRTKPSPILESKLAAFADERIIGSENKKALAEFAELDTVLLEAYKNNGTVGDALDIADEKASRILAHLGHDMNDKVTELFRAKLRAKFSLSRTGALLVNLHDDKTIVQHISGVRVDETQEALMNRKALTLFSVRRALSRAAHAVTAPARAVMNAPKAAVQYIDDAAFRKNRVVQQHVQQRPEKERFTIMPVRPNPATLKSIKRAKTTTDNTSKTPEAPVLLRVAPSQSHKEAVQLKNNKISLFHMSHTISGLPVRG